MGKVVPMGLKTILSSLRWRSERALLGIRDPEMDFERIGNLRPVAIEKNWEWRDVAPSRIQSQGPSKCLTEDFMLWVEHGTKMMRQHREYGKDPEITRKWAGTLHAQRKYETGESWTCKVPDALVLSRGGAVFTPDKKLIEESFYYAWMPRRSEWAPESADHISGPCVSLVTEWADSNYSHFVIDGLLRLAALEEPCGYSVLMPGPIKPWQRDLAVLAGASESNLHPVNRLLTRCENLKVARTSRYCFIPHLTLLETLRNRVLANLGKNEATLRPVRRIYLSREGGRRKMANEKELLPVLKEFGFEVVCPLDLSTRDQILMFSEAAAVASLHGSGFINTIFSPRGIPLIEIHHPKWWDGSSPRYAQLLGHDYWHAFGEEAGGDQDVTISPTKVERLLSHALNGNAVDGGTYAET